MISRRPDGTFAYFYAQGSEHKAYEVLGAHAAVEDGAAGFRFCVYAPHAQAVHTVGDFNDWDPASGAMELAAPSCGVWQVFIPDARAGQCYKYRILGADGVWRMKADPYGRASQLRSDTASILVEDVPYPWTDEPYFSHLPPVNQRPINIYEVHLFSWLQACTPTSGIDLETVGEQLALYAHHMHYTHIELLPLSEHPLDDSWGYQVTGFYALTGRIAHPDLFKKFVNRCHELGIGVILDWVPGHYCRDEQGLFAFDGTDLYGWEDHPHWGTRKFDFTQGHVRSFLISCALYWMQEYHLDGLRTDGVASMIDLNFAGGPWRTNEFGGTQDLAAMSFLREVNRSVHAHNPSAILCAEDSSTFPGITSPQEYGGLGFNYKWDMGWMHDSLDYMKVPPYFRRAHHNKLTFSMSYAFHENYLLSLSHDEVVHGKLSVINRMPGSYEEQFAQVRLLMTWQITHPGKKLNFMGNEFGQFIEWRFSEPLEFVLLQYPSHADLWNFNRELNRLYLDRRELWALDKSWDGFSWIQADNFNDSVYAYTRKDERGHELLVILNMTNITHEDFRVGLSRKGQYRELLNSDAHRFGGQNRLNPEPLETQTDVTDHQPYTLHLRLPGYTAIVLERVSLPAQQLNKTKGE